MSTRILIAFAAAGALATVVAGCASRGSNPPFDLEPVELADLQATMPVRPADGGRPAIALVLGGGGLRGFAHIGVLRALEEAGIRPDIVVGTSAGAVVGAAYASGMSPAQIEAAARDVRLSSLIDWTFSSQGFMRGDNIAAWIERITAGVAIERFPIRFGAVATDLQTARAVLLTRGPAGRAVQASAAVPGANVPVAYAGGHLVDGGTASLVPVRFARAMGAVLVIAVDVYCRDVPVNDLGAFAVMRRVMHAQSCTLAATEMAEADVLIAPAIRVSSLSAPDEQDRAMRTGYEAAREALVGIAQERERRAVLASPFHR